MIRDIFEKLHYDYSYEIRDMQIKLAEKIDEAIFNNSELIIEAETGSGKTLAYLLPSILNAINNNKKLVISTNTINLQDQILNKELPLIEKLLNTNLNYTLVKGRNNFVCIRKIEENIQKNVQYDEIYKEITTMNIGDRSKLKSKINNTLWNEIKSDKNTTLSKRCPYYNKCFYYNNKKLQKEAQIFIVNHHILMLDSIIKEKEENFLLPNYDILVVDEAHNLENVARKCYTNTFSFSNFFKNLGILYNRNVRDINKSGYIFQLLDLLKKDINHFENEKIRDIYINELNNIYDTSLSFMKNIYKNEIKENKSKLLTNKIDLLYEDVFDKIEKSIKELIRINKIIWDIVDNKNDEDITNKYILCNKIFSEVNDEFLILKDIFNFDLEKYFIWLEFENKNDIYFNINQTLYDISNEFDDNINKKVSSKIYLSATMTVNKSFDYIKKTLALEKSNEFLTSSIFDYKDQMNIFIASDLDMPVASEFKNQMSEFILRYVSNNNGKTFVLFTSYTDLNYVSEYLNKNNTNLNILTQGMFERNELIEKFKKESNSILLGTDSFWEGVDVKGHALNSIIIPKLPFQVPDEPITKAICEKMKKNGINSFINYQLPYSIIKMKQGVGRLIRSKEDKGNIIILDKRIYQKAYGKTILKSLPNAKVEILTKEEILSKYIP